MCQLTPLQAAKMFPLNVGDDGEGQDDNDGNDD